MVGFSKRDLPVSLCSSRRQPGVVMAKPKPKMKQKKTKNEGGGKTSNLPPPQKETGGGGETLNPSSHQREIGGGETLSSASSIEISGEETSNHSLTEGREEIRVTTDPYLINCSICTNPLCPPLYQCISGHVACTTCWSKVQNKCPTCNNPIGSRIIALEVLESIHLPCIYASLGCRQCFSYSQMQMHTKTCEFGPSLCPIPGCAHKAFSGEWRAHFRKDHWNPGPNYSDVGSFYSYGQPCHILQFDEEVLYYTLLGPGKDLFLLVKEPSSVGYALFLYYIDLPDEGQNVFPYELEVITRDNCITNCDNCITNYMQRKSKAVSIKEWKRDEVRDFSLLLPLGYDWRSTKVHVLINKELDI